MKKTRLLALLLALVMVAAMFAACNGTEPETTTTAATTTEATTTEATTTEATTTEATTTEATTTEATTTEDVGLDGYEFSIGNNGFAGYVNDPSTEKGAEFAKIVEDIEDKLNCTMTFVAPGSTDNMDAIFQLVSAGDYGYDIFRVRQSSWIPCAVNGYTWALDELADQFGLDIYNEDMCNQVYLKMSEMNGHYWAIDFTGKFDDTSLGHFYAFNSTLVDKAGTPAADLYQAIRDFKWDYDMFLDIAGKITEDTDGDGSNDIWGVALDTDGNEAWSNGTGPIIQNADGKWVANLQDPNVLESLEFMYKLSGIEYEYPVYGDTVGRGDRRSMFYAGECGFAGLYGGNIDEGGTGSITGFQVGIAPIPHGPNATNYCMNVVDCDWHIMLKTHKNPAAACAVINEFGKAVCNWEDYIDQLYTYVNGSDECMEIFNDYLLPNGKMNIAKCSENMYQIVRKEFYRDIYTLEKTAAQAAEAYNDVVQAELDLIFKQ